MQFPGEEPELGFEVNDIIIATGPVDDAGFCPAFHRGVEGVVPLSYLTELEPYFTGLLQLVHDLKAAHKETRARLPLAGIQASAQSTLAAELSLARQVNLRRMCVCACVFFLKKIGSNNAEKDNII